jgi:trehalose-6-phosphate synthase
MILSHMGRMVTVKAFPAGIPYTRFETLAKNAPPANFPEGLKIILGVDRLDYTKGIPQRLLAMEALFENFPEHIGKVDSNFFLNYF